MGHREALSPPADPAPVGKLQPDACCHALVAVSYPISLKGLSIGMAQFYGYVAGQNVVNMA